MYKKKKKSARENKSLLIYYRYSRQWQHYGNCYLFSCAEQILRFKGFMWVIALVAARDTERKRETQM